MVEDGGIFTRCFFLGAWNFKLAMKTSYFCQARTNVCRIQVRKFAQFTWEASAFLGLDNVCQCTEMPRIRYLKRWLFFLLLQVHCLSLKFWSSTSWFQWLHYNFLRVFFTSSSRVTWYFHMFTYVHISDCLSHDKPPVGDGENIMGQHP